MTSEASAQVQSLRAKLSNIAKAEGVLYSHVMTLFLLERASVRLLRDKTLAQNLIFKGGYVAFRVYRSPRHTTDIDALVVDMPIASVEELTRRCMVENLHDGCWFLFEECFELKAQGEFGGIRIAFRGGVGEPPDPITRAQVVNIDLGIGDAVTPSSRSVDTQLTLGEGSISWRVYPIETMIAEKLHGLVSIGARNSRSKDVFDLAHFLPKADRKILVLAIKNTFSSRGDQVPKRVSEVVHNLDQSNLRRGWNAAVASLKSAPRFEDAYAEIVSQLRLLDDE